MNVIKARLFVIIHPIGNRSKLLMERNVINVINVGKPSEDFVILFCTRKVTWAKNNMNV